MNAESSSSDTGSSCAPDVVEAVAATPRWPVRLLAVATLLVVLFCGLLWDRLSRVQDQVQRQTAEAGVSAIEARALVRQSQEYERALAARLAVVEARLGEVVLQRNQLDDMLHSLSRSRDESLAIDIESALRLALQQAQQVGSVDPLVLAMTSAQQRLQRGGQARLAAVHGALTRDLARLKAAPRVDMPAQLTRVDELLRSVDELPLLNAQLPSAPSVERRPEAVQTDWWRRGLDLVLDEFRALVSVRRIDQPEAMLLTPEQALFVREHIKLRLLHARLNLLARQADAVRSDLRQVGLALGKYFDAGSVRTRAAVSLLQQTQEQLKVWESPRLDDTMAALAQAAGR